MKISDLAVRVYEARKAGQPFTLLLGAGASISSGIMSNQEIVDDVLRRFHDDCEKEETQLHNLRRIWENRPAFRTEFRREYFEGREPSSGYRSLGKLIREGFFRPVLTMNFDRLLEINLERLQCFPLVLSRNELTGEKLRIALQEATPVILKLHVPDQLQDFLWMAGETVTFENAIQPKLADLLAKELIVCGYSFSDQDMSKLIAAGTEIGRSRLYNVNPEGWKGRAEQTIEAIRQRRETELFRQSFDEFFRELEDAITEVQVVREYPSPISVAWTRVQQVSNPDEHKAALMLAVEATVRLVWSALLDDARRSLAKSERHTLGSDFYNALQIASFQNVVRAIDEIVSKGLRSDALFFSRSIIEAWHKQTIEITKMIDSHESAAPLPELRHQVLEGLRSLNVFSRYQLIAVAPRTRFRVKLFGAAFSVTIIDTSEQPEAFFIPQSEIEGIVPTFPALIVEFRRDSGKAGLEFLFFLQETSAGTFEYVDTSGKHCTRQLDGNPWETGREWHRSITGKTRIRTIASNPVAQSGNDPSRIPSGSPEQNVPKSVDQAPIPVVGQSSAEKAPGQMVENNVPAPYMAAGLANAGVDSTSRVLLDEAGSTDLVKFIASLFPNADTNTVESILKQLGYRRSVGLSAVLTDLEITRCIKAGFPVIFLLSHEEERVLSALAAIARANGFTLYSWSYHKGITDIDNKTVFQYIENAGQVIDWSIQQEPNTIVVLKDFHDFLVDPLIVRKVRDARRSFRGRQKSLILLSPYHIIPTDLERDVRVIAYPLPQFEELDMLLNEVITKQGVKENYLSEEERSLDEFSQMGLHAQRRLQLIDGCRGLTLQEAKNLFSKAVSRNGGIFVDSIAEIIHEKEQLIKKSGFLEFCHTPEKFTELGGLDDLKYWLLSRRRPGIPLWDFLGLPTPKGILLLGVPGCGKSLCAKAVAAEWNLPLLRLDLGRIFGSLVGESEANLRQSIEIAEATAPCVLWIDEVEKGFSDVWGGSNGVTNRIFGILLTWMQEKTSSVFVVATANEISSLPPEFLRKGRFDEVFFVDLPGNSEREQIFRIHLDKRHQDPRKFPIADLARSSQGYSGAEIEQVIISALHEAFAKNQELGPEHVRTSLKELVPLTQTADGDVSRLRRLARTISARPADRN